MMPKIYDAVVWMSLLSVCLSAMMIPAKNRAKGTAVWQKCKWICLNQQQSAGYCPCSLYRKHLRKRSNSDDVEYSQSYDVIPANGMDTEELLDQLLGELLFYVNTGKGSSYQKGRLYQPAENSILALTKPHKRAYLPGDNNNKATNFKTTNDNDEDIDMVRSKKRWLSLHEFDSQDGSVVVPDLWKEDGSRKAFRYG